MLTPPSHSLSSLIQSHSLLPFTTNNFHFHFSISLMECTLGLFGPSGSGSFTAINDSNASTMDILHKDFVGKAPIDPLGLALALGSGDSGGGQVHGGGWADRARILTAQDFPLHAGSVSGTKRAADSAPVHGGSPAALNQVVGWPPIRTYRMNSLVNQGKTARAEQEDVVSEANKDPSKDNKTRDVDGTGNIGFVKVNVDGVVIGRKVDLSAHSCYETLAFMLEDMFFRSPGSPFPNGHSGDKEQARKLSKLLDGCSEFVLTYEDTEGDWMLVGDVPWGMFLSSVQRLRIMRTSEANGLAPRSQDKKLKQRSKPI